MRKLFSTFPGEWPGVGLLLLRALVGGSLIAQGVSYLHSANGGFGAWGLAGLAFAGAALLLLGLMTPLVACLVAASGAGIALSWIPSPGLLDGYLAIVNLIGLPVVIALLGPGAFSFDARMYGRREITIPSSKY